MENKSTKGAINTRADLKTEKGIKITDKHVAVYFAYLVRSYRNPNGQEKHRYLYLKDISKKEIGTIIGVSQPTMRAAEQRLEELGYIYFSADRKIIYFPDHNIYSWIPIECLTLLLELSKAKECGGDILRLYAAIHYYKDTPQSFSARTWVYAFGLSETNQTNYLHIHTLLYILKLYGFIDYELKTEVASGRKKYLSYENVVVLNTDSLRCFDETIAPLNDKVEEYKKIVASGFME